MSESSKKSKKDKKKKKKCSDDEDDNDNEEKQLLVDTASSHETNDAAEMEKREDEKSANKKWVWRCTHMSDDGKKKFNLIALSLFACSSESESSDSQKVGRDFEMIEAEEDEDEE